MRQIAFMGSKMIISPKEEYEHLTKGSEKKIRLKCDGCGRESTTTYNNYTQFQRKRNFSGETFCQKCAAAANGKAACGKPSPFKGIARPEMRREKSPCWNGGRYIDVHGYVMILIESGPRNGSGWKKYRKEHIIVMESHLGRKLRKGEIVHHIDGNRQNNDISNLSLLNHRKHRDAHQSLQEIGYKLVKLGLISYDVNHYVADGKLRELLEQLEVANQQPSPESNFGKGSETSSESQVDNNSATSAGRS
jgi:hypothetical protein